ncbi:shikimate dehydrogenase [Solirhodobacter olei]|uniref:shikimate dehydrogenase n=1 Tax=Solirhodobacter olei TaxID=2493082 RepID=UPI000FDBB114|nr:shikimate dehydrogenase [Solirhodobacter olei]
MSRSPRAFVMGHPIKHSRSPMLHGYWLDHYGIEGSYEMLDIAPEALAGFFASYRETGWIGGNVTVPHKSAVMPFLDRIDPAAEAMGAVNTVYWDGDVLAGDNTDALGFMHNLDDRAPGWQTGASRAVVLGAGGAARAAAYGLMSRGLDVAIVNRTEAKAQALAQHLGRGVSSHSLDALSSLLGEADLLVNATSLGMVHQPPLQIDLSPLKAGATVCDVVYVPLETDLLRSAKARGHRTVDGLGMLLHQAVVGFSRWFGVTPEVTGELRTLLEEDIRAKSPGA